MHEGEVRLVDAVLDGLEIVAWPDVGEHLQHAVAFQLRVAR
jgi:hypothetical protein